VWEKEQLESKSVHRVRCLQLLRAA
jgi:hypothetical protein